MRYALYLFLFAAVSCGATVSAAGEDRILTLEEAVGLALQARDPSVRRFEEQAGAFDDRAVAESQLPDPQLGVTMQNLPTSFDYTQEPMTQFQTRLRQSFPAGRTLELRGEQRRAEGEGARQAARLKQLEIALETRLSWLEMFYWMRAQDRIAASRAAVLELEEATRADYAAGRGTSQTLMRTRLELSLLDDRLIEAGRRHEVVRADLARFIGEAAARRAFPDRLPVLKQPEDIVALRDGLMQHPAIGQADAVVAAQGAAVEIARQQYKPDWAVEAGYGVRGGNRDDFLTVGVTVDIPLFTGKRQDRSVSAARRERQAALLSKDSQVLELERQLLGNHAAWSRLGERARLHRQAVTVRAAETTEASMSSYQSGFTDFSELIRARLAELDAELSLIRLEVDYLQGQARLLFFEGEF